MQEPSLLRLSDLGRSSNLTPISLSELCIKSIREKKLAEKVLSGKRLNKSEREEIYRILTGKEPIIASTKIGRPSTVDRDFRLAIDYLYQKADGKKRTDKLRQELAKEHGLSGRENTFYVALNRGIADWHDLATYWIDHYNKGGFSDCTEEENRLNLERMQRALQLIEEHRKAGVKLQKKITE